MLNIEALLDQLGGCGLFQFLVAFSSGFSYMTSCYAVAVMTFGIYNPGWRCMDHKTTNTSFNATSYINSSNASFLHNNITSDNKASLINKLKYSDTCESFSSCKDVEFSSDAYTIATEWALICDNTWVTSTIISIQMAGLAIGHFLSSYMTDVFGRKRTVLVVLTFGGILMFASIFANSWQVFGTILFFVGISAGTNVGASRVYVTEFVPPKWRAIMSSLPMWTLGATIFALCAMLLKNWKGVHLVSGGLHILAVLLMCFVPESLRWVKVKGREKRFKIIASRIAKINRKPSLPDDDLHLYAQLQERENAINKRYHLPALFKREYVFFTLFLGIGVFCVNNLYFTISFGVSALPGNVYVNTIVQFAAELPANFIAWFAPDYFGRRKTGIFTTIIVSVFMASYIGIDQAVAPGNFRRIFLLVCAVIVKSALGLYYCVAMILANELYPTTIRGTAVGMVMTFAGVGATISPTFLIHPRVLFGFYICMSVIYAVLSVTMLYLPETNGKHLVDEPTLRGNNGDTKPDSMALVTPS